MVMQAGDGSETARRCLKVAHSGKKGARPSLALLTKSDHCAAFAPDRVPLEGSSQMNCRDGVVS